MKMPLTKEDYGKILKDADNNVKEVFQHLSEHERPVAKVAEKLSMKLICLNSLMGKFAKKAANKYGIDLQEIKVQGVCVSLFFDIKEKRSPYYWRLKPELKDALSDNV
jgi:hypothetical protein